MSGNVAVFWDSKMTFHRLVEDSCGYCEGVTPLMLSAPFYKGRYAGIIIPTGFGNTQYSKLLPALRASSGRFTKYLQNGGRVLVYGAMDDGPNKYDWLPVKVSYHHEFAEHSLTVDESSPWKVLLDGYDKNAFTTDGWFEEFEGKPIAVAENGFPILVECKVGEGTLLLSTAHEYPSRAFLEMFQKGGDETLF